MLFLQIKPSIYIQYILGVSFVCIYLSFFFSRVCEWCLWTLDLDFWLLQYLCGRKFKNVLHQPTRQLTSWGANVVNCCLIPSIILALPTLLLCTLLRVKIQITGPCAECWGYRIICVCEFWKCGNLPSPQLDLLTKRRLTLTIPPSFNVGRTWHRV